MAGVPYKIFIPKWKKQIGVVARDLRNLQDILCAKLHLAPGFQVALEDGTLVCEEDYFKVLPPQTKLVVLENTEQSQTVSSTAEYQQTIGQKRASPHDEQCPTLPKQSRLSSGTPPITNWSFERPQHLYSLHHQQQQPPPQQQQQRLSPVSNLVISNVAGNVPMSVSPPMANNPQQQSPPPQYIVQQPNLQLMAQQQQHHLYHMPVQSPPPRTHQQHRVSNHSRHPVLVSMNNGQAQYRVVPQPQQQQQQHLLYQQHPRYRVIAPRVGEIMRPRLLEDVRRRPPHPALLMQVPPRSLTTDPTPRDIRTIPNGIPPAAQNSMANGAHDRNLVAASRVVQLPFNTAASLPDCNQQPSSVLLHHRPSEGQLVSPAGNSNHNNSVAISEVDRQIEREINTLRIPPLVFIPPGKELASQLGDSFVSSQKNAPTSQSRLKVVHVDKDTDETGSVSSDCGLVINDNDLQRTEEAVAETESVQQQSKPSPAKTTPASPICIEDEPSAVSLPQDRPSKPVVPFTKLLADAMTDYLASIKKSLPSKIISAPQPSISKPNAPLECITPLIESISIGQSPLIGALSKLSIVGVEEPSSATNVGMGASESGEPSPTNTCRPKEPSLVTSPSPCAESAKELSPSTTRENTPEASGSALPSSVVLSSDTCTPQPSEAVEPPEKQSSPPLVPNVDKPLTVTLSSVPDQPSSDEKPEEHSVSNPQTTLKPSTSTLPKHSPRKQSSVVSASPDTPRQDLPATPKSNVRSKSRMKAVYKSLKTVKQLSIPALSQIDIQTAQMVQSVKRKIYGNDLIKLGRPAISNANSSKSHGSSLPEKRKRRATMDGGGPAKICRNRQKRHSVDGASDEKSNSQEHLFRSEHDSGEKTPLKEKKISDRLRSPDEGYNSSSPVYNRLPFADFDTADIVEVEVLECSSMLDDAFLCGEDDDLESVSVAQESHSPDTEEKGGLLEASVDPLMVRVPLSLVRRVIAPSAELQFPNDSAQKECIGDDASPTGDDARPTTGMELEISSTSQQQQRQQQHDSRLVVSLPITCRSGQLYYDGVKREKKCSKSSIRPRSSVSPIKSPLHPRLSLSPIKSPLEEFFTLCENEEEDEDADRESVIVEPSKSLDHRRSFVDLTTDDEPDSVTRQDTIAVAEFASEELIFTTPQRSTAAEVDTCLREIIKTAASLPPCSHPPTSTPASSRSSPVEEHYRTSPPASPRCCSLIERADSPTLIGSEVVVSGKEAVGSDDLLESVVSQFRRREETISTSVVEMDFECAVFHDAVTPLADLRRDRLVDPRLEKYRLCD